MKSPPPATFANQSRYFTIASSSLASPKELRIVVKVEARALEGGRVWKGLASGFFSHNLKLSQPIPIKFFLEKSVFRAPEGGAPCLMIGIGSGVAPFVGMIEEKAALRGAGKDETGAHWLVLGVRHPDQDFLYKELIEGAHKEGALKGLDVAFSKAEGRHVQDALRARAPQVAELLVDQKGTAFICGSLAMSQSVVSTLRDCLRSALKLEEPAAEALVLQLKAEKRIAFEAWG